MTNARLFGKIIDRYVRPAFQEDMEYIKETAPNRKVDRYLISFLNYSYERSPIPFKFYYNSNSKDVSGGDDSLDNIHIVNCTFNLENMEIEIIFKPHFSKFFFKSHDDQWDNFLKKIKRTMQHELVHYYDFIDLPKSVIENVNFATCYDIGNLSKNPQKEKEKIYLDVVKFCNAKNDSGLDLHHLFIADKECNLLKKYVLKKFRKYKDPEKFNVFLDLFKQQAYGTILHTDAPTERRAISQEIILELFAGGMNKYQVLEFFKGELKESPSETLNNLLNYFGNTQKAFNDIRREAAHILTKLIERDKGKKR